MTVTQFLDWLELAALACLTLLGVGRALALYARGVRVVAFDRTWWPVQVPAALIAGTGLLLWAYEIVACAWPLPVHVVPRAWRAVLVNALTIKAVGAVVLLASVLVYGLALRGLGVSWRLGVDRDRPGPLVTAGIYARMRHPIYVGLGLFSIGTSLVLGQLLFLVLAALAVVGLHAAVLVEERFLVQIYGDAYREYCQRVGRYVTWR